MFSFLSYVTSQNGQCRREHKTKMSDQQDIFNKRKPMWSADHEVVTVSRNIVTSYSPSMKRKTAGNQLLLTTHHTTFPFVLFNPLTRHSD